MKTILEISPGVQLSGIVSHYSYKEMNIQKALTVPAYEEQFLEFYLEGTYTVINRQTNTAFASPPAIFIGQQTSRNWDLTIEGQYKMFAIHFEPTGFNRLFSLPMKEFTDKAIDPSLVLKNEFRWLQDRLCNTGSLQTIVQLIEEYLTSKLVSPAGNNNKFTEVIDYIIKNNGEVNLNYLVNQCNITVRQFERKFNEQVGISPKLFIKKTRFNHLLNLKKTTSGKNWTELTYLAGYFDQAHLIKDFKSFTADTPTRYIKKIQALPEIKIS